MRRGTDFYKQLRATLKTITPLVRFLNEPLVEARRPERHSHMLLDDSNRLIAIDYAGLITVGLGARA